MPLFGSKNKNSTTGHDGADRHHLMNSNNPAMENPSNNYPNTNTANPGRNAAGIDGHCQYATSNNLPQGQNPTTNDPQSLLDTNPTYLGAGGTTAPTQISGGGYYCDDTRIPPAGAINHGQPTATGGGAGQRFTGKVESAIGSMVGSNALKTKGMEKEQEANSFKLQARELAEAERLEHEALMRRERAVAHGAHPTNSALGAGHAGTGVSGSAGSDTRL